MFGVSPAPSEMPTPGREAAEASSAVGAVASATAPARRGTASNATTARALISLLARPELCSALSASRHRAPGRSPGAAERAVRTRHRRPHGRGSDPAELPAGMLPELCDPGSSSTRPACPGGRDDARSVANAQNSSRTPVVRWSQPLHSTVAENVATIGESQERSCEHWTGERGPEDVARFRAAFERHYEAVLGYALRRTATLEDAEEVTASTFATAWRRLDRLPPEPHTRTWLYRVVWCILNNKPST